MGRWQWIVSDALTFEVNKNQDWILRNRIKALMDAANQYIVIGEIEKVRSKKLETLSFKNLDALHLACAGSDSADVFLTGLRS